MTIFDSKWRKCEKCGIVAPDVKEGKCSDEKRCFKFAVDAAAAGVRLAKASRILRGKGDLP